MSEQQLDDSVNHGLDLLHQRQLTGDVFGLRVRSLSYSIKDNQVINSSQQDDVGLAFRLVKNNRIGFSFTVPGQEQRGLNQALELAELSSPVSDKHELKLAQPQSDPEVKTFDRDIANAIKNNGGSDIANKLINGVNSVAQDIKASQGYLGLSSSQKIIANSNGVFKKEKITGTGASITAAIAGQATTLTASESKSSRQLELNGDEIGQKAADKVDSMRVKATSAETGQVPAVLSPEALAQLLGNTVVPSLYAENVRRGNSLYQGRLGDNIADSSLTLRENPTADWGLGSSRFDDEGVISRDLPLIKEGQLTNFLYDIKESVKWEDKQESTANGIRDGFKSPPETSARNLIVEVGHRRREKLLAEGAIYVDRLLGAHTADAVSGDFSVAINPGWLLANGEKQGRLDGFMLSGNMPQLLQQIKLAKDAKYVNMGHSISLPTCLLPQVNVAGRQ